MQRDEILRAIQTADIMIIDDILGVAMNRKKELYPDWELFYCASEKGETNGPEKMIRAAWEFERRIKAKYG